MLRTLKGIEIPISGFRPIEEAIITSGGIEVKEITPKNMESKIVPGLYFAGEILNLNGPCGGYHIRWALSSGFLAGKSAVQTV